MVKNDWSCPRCRHLCFGRRQACEKCGTKNPTKPVGIAKKGDWYCPSCKELMFASRTECFKCGTKKDQERRAGDWDCECGEMNFGTRKECYKCGITKQASNAAHELRREKERLEQEERERIAEVARKQREEVEAIEAQERARRAEVARQHREELEAFEAEERRKQREMQERALADNANCIICLDAPKDSAIVPCGHAHFCYVCLHSVRHGHGCPICRKPITSIIKLFN